MIYLRKNIDLLVFVGILISLFFFLNLDELLFSPPGGTHYIRQTDSLSFAANYYNEGFNFFQPSNFNLQSESGNSACEFPILYYLTALSYLLFGINFLSLKIIHLILLFFGLIYLYKFLKHKSGSSLIGMLITLLLFTSTVFNYYAINYLPDIGALSFLFMGMYFYYSSKHKYQLLVAVMLFTLACLIKVTFVIYPLAFFGPTIILKLWNRHHVGIMKQMMSIGFILVCLVCWNIFVIQYNQTYNNTYYTTSIMPIWDLNDTQLTTSLNHILVHWYSKYFNYTTFHLIILSGVISSIFLLKQKKEYILKGIIMTIGVVSYFLLFFKQFKDHDYYFLILVPFFLFVVLGGIKSIRLLNRDWANTGITLILAITVIVGINYANGKLNDRLENMTDNFSAIGHEILKDDKINSILPTDAKVIVAYDTAPNGALLFLNKKGWTLKSETELSTQKTNELKSKGATHLVTSTKIVQVELNNIYHNNSITIYSL